MAKDTGLSYDDMAVMNIGDVLEYCYTWAEHHGAEKKSSGVREATQADIDAFF